MVEDDDVDAARFEVGDGICGGGAAINGQQQRGGVPGQAGLQGVQAQTVAVIHPMGQVTIDLPPERAQDLEEQRGGSDPIDVVIAENHHGFATLAGLEEPVYGGGHVRQVERIRQKLKPWLKESADGLRLGESAIQEALSDEGVEAQLARQLSSQEGVRGSDSPAKFHEPEAW